MGPEPRPWGSLVPAGLVLTPGASADRDHSTLVRIDDALGPLPVLRLTLATTSIPRAVAKIVDETNAFASTLGVGSDQLVIGGRSFGGRACSVAAAKGLSIGGLLLLSYPLHPPGKPEKLRVEHFGDLTVPTMFISGRRDPFGSPEEFDEHVGAVNASVTMRWVDGGHSPKGVQESSVVDMVVDAFDLPTD